MAEPPAPACGAPAPRWQVHRELEGPCVRVAGHDGWHLNGYGVSWTEVPPADPLVAVRPPAGAGTDWIAQARARCDAATPDTNKIRRCAPLLPPPGEEVVRELADALDAARADLPRALAALERVRALCDEWGSRDPDDDEPMLFVDDVRAVLDGDA